MTYSSTSTSDVITSNPGGKPTAADRLARMVAAYNAVIANGTLTKGQVLTMIAASSIETNDLFLLQRSDGSVYASASCYPTCVRVALELDKHQDLLPQLKSSGGALLGILIDPDWYSDSAGMAVLAKALNVQSATGTDGNTYWFHEYDFDTEWNQINQLGFEYALFSNKPNLLKQYDMGPMNMVCPGMGPVATTLGWKTVPGFPTDLTSMWDLYNSSDYASAYVQASPWYVPPIFSGTQPGDDPGDSSGAVTSWCQRQLGATSATPAVVSYTTALKAKLALLISNV